jgi:hypothetical protein
MGGCPHERELGFSGRFRSREAHMAAVAPGPCRSGLGGSTSQRVDACGAAGLWWREEGRPRALCWRRERAGYRGGRIWAAVRACVGIGVWTDGGLRRLRRGIARRSLTREIPSGALSGWAWVASLLFRRRIHIVRTQDAFAPSCGEILDFARGVCVWSGLSVEAG